MGCLESRDEQKARDNIEKEHVRELEAELEAAHASYVEERKEGSKKSRRSSDGSSQGRKRGSRLEGATGGAASPRKDFPMDHGGGGATGETETAQTTSSEKDESSTIGATGEAAKNQSGAQPYKSANSEQEDMGGKSPRDLPGEEGGKNGYKGKKGKGKGKGKRGKSFGSQNSRQW